MKAAERRLLFYAEPLRIPGREGIGDGLFNNSEYIVHISRQLMPGDLCNNREDLFMYS